MGADVATITVALAILVWATSLVVTCGDLAVTVALVSLLLLFRWQWQNGGPNR